MKLMISHLHLKTKEWKMDVNDRKTAISLGRHEAERRQYEVEQKKTGDAGGYLSGSILLVPAADIRM
ncbi:hypothetical protein T12_10156, partial [Trichinella patagoniensis]